MDNLSKILIPKIFKLSKLLGYRSSVGPKIFFKKESFIPDFIMYNSRTAFIWEWSRHKLDRRKKKQLQKYHMLAQEAEFSGEVNFKGEKINVIFIVLEKYYQEYLNFVNQNNLNINLCHISVVQDSQPKLMLPKSLAELEMINHLENTEEYLFEIDVDNFSFLKIGNQIETFIEKNIFDLDEIISNLISKEILSILSPSLKRKLKRSILKYISTILTQSQHQNNKLKSH